MLADNVVLHVGVTDTVARKDKDFSFIIITLTRNVITNSLFKILIVYLLLMSVLVLYVSLPK